MIMVRRALVSLSLSMVAAAPAAQACLPLPPEPRLVGESDGSYRDRVASLERQREAERPAREAEALRRRQDSALQHASMIFIARNTPWSPSPRSTRRGRPVPPPVHVPDILTSRFTPTAWLRGRPANARFVVEALVTTCGDFVGVGDTVRSQPGEEFVFFARRAPFTRETLIDAISVDRVTDPVLIAFVRGTRRQ